MSAASVGRFVSRSWPARPNRIRRRRRRVRRSSRTPDAWTADKSRCVPDGVSLSLSFSRSIDTALTDCNHTTRNPLSGFRVLLRAHIRIRVEPKAPASSTNGKPPNPPSAEPCKRSVVSPKRVRTFGLKAGYREIAQSRERSSDVVDNESRDAITNVTTYCSKSLKKISLLIIFHLFISIIH